MTREGLPRQHRHAEITDPTNLRHLDYAGEIIAQELQAQDHVLAIPYYRDQVKPLITKVLKSMPIAEVLFLTDKNIKSPVIQEALDSFRQHPADADEKLVLVKDFEALKQPGESANSVREYLAAIAVAQEARTLSFTTHANTWQATPISEEYRLGDIKNFTEWIGSAVTVHSATTGRVTVSHQPKPAEVQPDDSFSEIRNWSRLGVVGFAHAVLH